MITSQVLRSFAQGWSSLLSHSILWELSSSFSCSSCSCPATASSCQETSLTCRSRALASAWASMVFLRSFWAFWSSTLTVTYSSLNKPSIASNCSLLCINFSFLDLVHDFSRDFHSLRRHCSNARSSHSRWNTCCTRRSADYVVPTTSGREVCFGAWRQGRPIMTSSLLSSSGGVAAAPICILEEDAPTAGSVLGGHHQQQSHPPLS
jgi:hypothetical protein